MNEADRGREYGGQNKNKDGNRRPRGKLESRLGKILEKKGKILFEAKLLARNKKQGHKFMLKRYTDH